MRVCMRESIGAGQSESACAREGVCEREHARTTPRAPQLATAREISRARVRVCMRERKYW